VRGARARPPATGCASSFPSRRSCRTRLPIPPPSCRWRKCWVRERCLRRSPSAP
jgi:hypothetical protein